MSALVRWSVRMRGLVLGLAAALLVLGVVQLRDARVDVLPESAPPYVEIQTEALGLSAAEVEQFVTVPMEALMLNGVAWVDSIDSRSVPGLSSIVLTFEPGTDLMRARQMVQERLTQSHALPNVSKPPQMIQPLSTSSRLMIVSLSSTELSPIDLSVLARWTVRPRLMGVPGVANVAIWGQRERQLQVLVDPARLNEAGVTLDQIVRTTGNALWVSPLSFLNASTPGAGGFIDTPNQRLGIRHILPIRTPEDLSRVAIEGEPNLRIGDVADVVEDHQPLIGDASTDSGQALLLVVEKLPGEDVVAVSRGVEDALAAMAPGLAGVTIDTTIYRPATFVETAVANLGLTLLLAALVAAVVVVAFLRQLRTVAITLVAVSCAVVAAALVLHLAGATLNVLVVAGLVVALGVIVDDAVVDLDDLLRRLRQRDAAHAHEALPVGESLSAAIGRMRGTMTYATAIVLLLVVPVLVIDGTAGAFLRPFATTFALAVVASMVVALTITPALAALLLRGPAVTSRPTGTLRLPGGVTVRRARSLRQAHRDRLVGSHAALLGRTMRQPVVVLGAAAALLIAGLAVAPVLGRDLAPSFQERDLLVDIAAVPGTSAPAMTRITTQASAELRAVAGVERVGTHVGRAVMSDEVVNVNEGQLWVRIAADADYAATVAAIQGVVAGYPGLTLRLGSYLNDRAAEAFTEPADALAVRVFGPDEAQLLASAEAVRSAMAGVDGVTGARVIQQRSEPTIQVTVDLDAAYEHGVRPGDVRRAAATLVNGLEVGNLFEEQKVFEVMVVGVPGLRHSLGSIESLGIDTPGGGQVALGELASVELAPAPVAIDRSGISRYLDVVAGVEGRDVGAVQADVAAAVRGVAFPLEYHAEVTTTQAERTGALVELAGVTTAVAIGILLVFQAALGSWRLAAVSMGVLAVAVAGGLVAVAVVDGALGLGALVGCFAVVALAARNQLALLARLQALAHTDGPLEPEDVVRAAGERVRPVLTTALTTSLALVPVLILGERPGLELLVPMAVVILGGLAATTLLTLVVVPTLYLGLRPTPSAEPVDVALPHAAEPQPAGAH